jgi:hypothetical protein
MAGAFLKATISESGVTCVYQAGRHVRRHPEGQQYAVLPRGAVLQQNAALPEDVAAQQNVAPLRAVLHQHVAAA